MAYIDDLVVMSDDWNEHLERLRCLLERLKEAGLTLNLSKSHFAKGTVSYLGYTVGSGLVRPKNANVDAILKFPPPQTRRMLMQFLGMCGYYRRFCSNFAAVAAPLTALTSTKRTFKWNSECHQAFENLKGFLSSTPVLRAPDYTQPFFLQVDASGVGVGAALLQRDASSGVLHPVAYYSAKLKSHQLAYSTIEKEGLALVSALKKFECYLLHHPDLIQVYSDHNPLVFIDKAKLQNQRILRWALLLQSYNLKVNHIRGVDNIIEDALSRSPQTSDLE